MADPTDHRDANGALDSQPSTGTPRWVKVFGLIALMVILLFVILMLTRGPGGHGPGRHVGY